MIGFRAIRGRSALRTDFTASPDEAAEIIAAAERIGQTVSAFCRSAALAMAREATPLGAEVARCLPVDVLREELARRGDLGEMAGVRR